MNSRAISSQGRLFVFPHKSCLQVLTIVATDRLILMNFNQEAFLHTRHRYTNFSLGLSLRNCLTIKSH